MSERAARKKSQALPKVELLGWFRFVNKSHVEKMVSFGAASAPPTPLPARLAAPFSPPCPASHLRLTSPAGRPAAHRRPRLLGASRLASLRGLGPGGDREARHRLARQPHDLPPAARVPQDRGPARLVHLGRPERRQHAHHVAQPAHPPVLRLVLVARLGLGPRRPHQDQAQGQGHRHQPLGAAHAQLRPGRLVPRRLGRRPVPVDPRHVVVGHRHLLRDPEPVPGLLLRVDGGHLPRRRLELLRDERRAHLLDLPAAGQVRRPRQLPQRHHLRVRLDLGRRRHGQGDLRPRPHRLRH